MSVSGLGDTLAAACAARSRSGGSRSERGGGGGGGGGSERTLAIIKPEAYGDREAIENAIVANGFTVLAKRQVRLTPEQAAELYQAHYGREYFPQLVAQLSAGPVAALALAAADAVQKWRALMGPARVEEAQAYWPRSLRASYGRRSEHAAYCNGLHGSESDVEARREIHFFFPTMVVGPVVRRWQVRDYVHRRLLPTLQPALARLAQLRPAEPLLWLARDLRLNNPNEPVWRAPDAAEEHERKCYTPRHSELSLPSV